MITMAGAKKIVYLYGADIIFSNGMQMEKNFLQHGNITVFEHSMAVACMCLFIAARLHVKVNRRALVRGALLHDYFLYDWHEPDRSHRLHGFRHARWAARNASRDFKIGLIERDVIEKHMFPLNPVPPRYRESVIVCLADKICAVCEMMSVQVVKDIEKTKHENEITGKN